MAATYAQLAAVVTKQTAMAAAEAAVMTARNEYQAAVAAVVAAGGGTLTADVGGTETVMRIENGQVSVGGATRLTAP